MLDFTHFFIGSALAQDAASPPGGSGTSMFMNFLPLVLIFGVFYVLIIRPQQKKVEEQARMIKALQRGDKVITSGGIYGKIVKIDGEEAVTLEIAEGVNIKIARAQIGALAVKPVPVIDSDNKKS